MSPRPTDAVAGPRVAVLEAPNIVQAKDWMPHFRCGGFATPGMRGMDKMEDRFALLTDLSVPGISELGSSELLSPRTAAAGMKSWDKEKVSKSVLGATSVPPTVGGLEKMHVAAVFDGHRGSEAASFAANNLKRVV